MLKKKLMRLLIWFSFVSLIFAGLGLNLARASAQEPANPEATVQFAEPSGQGKENLIYPKVKVSLLPDVLDSEVTFDYQIVGGTAARGVDYEMADGSASIEPGKISTDLPLKIIDNYVVSQAKTIIIILANAVGATLGEPKTFTYTILDDDSLPLTKVLTDPILPNGQNGWFVTFPTIDFTTDREAETFYQWNTTLEGNWKNYDNTPLVAAEGSNTLYYYSVDNFGNKEDIQAEVIKVDTLVPTWPPGDNLGVTVDEEGHIHLSWNLVGEAAYYEVWRAESPYQLIASQIEDNFFLDETTLEGHQYSYEVFAVDQAGNKSQASQVTVAIAPIEKVIMETVPTTMETPQVSPAIIEGVQTPEPAAEITEAEKPTEVAQNIEPEPTKTETRNWNRLLLAISILIIAAGAAVGGYYGYEWWLARKEETPRENEPRSKSRW